MSLFIQDDTNEYNQLSKIKTYRNRLHVPYGVKIDRQQETYMTVSQTALPLSACFRKSLALVSAEVGKLLPETE